jgi:hypothetical protein
MKKLVLLALVGTLPFGASVSAVDYVPRKVNRPPENRVIITKTNQSTTDRKRGG